MPYDNSQSTYYYSLNKQPVIEIINGKFDIPKLALDQLQESYPYPEVIEVEIQTKKFSHVVLTDTKCPSCSHMFKASEIKEYVEIGYRCPMCRQVIRLK